MESNATDRALTVEEFERLPADDAFRIELVRGRVVREPRPGAYHGVLAVRLFRALDAYVRTHGLGEVLMETGFRLPGDPALVRGPDIAFIAAARFPRQVPRRGFWNLAPDLAVEVASPHDRWTSLQEKAADYLDAGTRAVWIIDPQHDRATICRRDTPHRVLTRTDTLSGGDVVPGFTLPIATLFDG